MSLPSHPPIAERLLITAYLGLTGYADLLSALPDRFFHLTPSAELQAWRSLYRLVRQGESDPQRLAASLEIPNQNC